MIIPIPAWIYIKLISIIGLNWFLPTIYGYYPKYWLISPIPIPIYTIPIPIPIILFGFISNQYRYQYRFVKLIPIPIIGIGYTDLADYRYSVLYSIYQSGPLFLWSGWSGYLTRNNGKCNQEIQRFLDKLQATPITSSNLINTWPNSLNPRNHRGGGRIPLSFSEYRDNAT